MTDFNWTAENLYELVKELPDGARPDGLVYHGPDTGKCYDWEMKTCDGGGWGPVPVAHAVLAHTGSVLGWLASKQFIEVVQTQDGKWHAYGRDLVSGSGPTLLHALCAAAKAVGG